MRSVTRYRTVLLMTMVALAGGPSAPAGVQASGPADLTFGLNLFKTVCKQNAGKNVVVSPSSGYMVLALASLGADGNTEKQLLNALGVPGAAADLRKQIKDIRSKAKTQKAGITLESANAIFVDSAAPLAEGFADTTKTDFGGEVIAENFSSQATVEKINKWCADHTHGKINSIIDRLLPENLMVLINALYFKGKWQSQFDPQLTKPGKFNLSEDKQESVSMMNQQSELQFFAGSNFTSICLPYVGNELQMFVFLPNKNSSLSAFQEQLNEKSWKTWMSGYSFCPVTVQLPKFKIQFKRKLNEVLQQLKIKDAFSPGVADFSKMFKSTARKPHIGYVIQKTYIDVNEEGSEAAAATAVVGSKGLDEAQPQHFVVDRPFAFALMNRKTNQLLFLGSVADPSAR